MHAARFVSVLLGFVAACGQSHGRPGADAMPDVAADTAVASDAGPIDAPDDSPPVACDRQLSLLFVPTKRVQLAVWLEAADGRLSTVALTEAVGLRGIGNRPGAMLMNSGYRWPHGRRESVLPYWAHRRAESGARLFPRVIFQDRVSEGYASRTACDMSPENYYCLSFDVSTTRRDALDAVTCATPMHNDKGRYITPEDVARGYAEPWEPLGETRALSLESYYPPRRDLDSVSEDERFYDHPDLLSYDRDARAAMPELDAVTMATPIADSRLELTIDVPEDWPLGPIRVRVEVNTEGDYNERWNDATHPTIADGEQIQWDYWAVAYGYPWRGQPSVIYEIDATLPLTADQSATTPIGYTDHLGVTGTLNPIDDTITDDPVAQPGSGADRLHLMHDGTRLILAPSPCP